MSPPNYQYTSQNSQYTVTSVYSLCNCEEKLMNLLHPLRRQVLPEIIQYQRDRINGSLSSNNGRWGCIHQPWLCNLSFLIAKLVFRNIHIFFADEISSGFSIFRIEIYLDCFSNMLLYFSLISRYSGQYRIKCSSSSISVWQEKQNRWSLGIEIK